MTGYDTHVAHLYNKAKRELVYIILDLEKQIQEMRNNDDNTDRTR